MVIANPISGHGASARRGNRIAELLTRRGCEVDLRPTRQVGDGRRFAAESSGYSVVVTVGGDGTINEVVNGLPDGGPPMALVPTGTANVLAKELMLRRTLPALADIIVEGHEVVLDLGVNLTTGRKFLLFASAGYDSFIVDRFLSRREGTIRMNSYIGWGLRSLATFEPPVISVEADGTLIEPRASWVEVANVAAYGGPLILAPDASPSDGLFDVMIQTAHQRRDAMRLIFAGLWRYYLRRPYEMPDMRRVRARCVTLRAEESVPLQLDGDAAGALPATFELRPKAIRILARTS